jgi:hypothetical protein
MRSESVPSEILLFRLYLAFQLPFNKRQDSKSAGNNHADDDEIGQCKLPYDQIH